VDVDVPPIRGGVRLSELALTSSSASETPTAGSVSILPPMPGPPTTRRSFRVGETITAGAALESAPGGPSEVTATVVRLADRLETPVVTALAPVLRPEGDAGYVVFTLPTDSLEPGLYAILLTPQDRPRSEASEVQIRLTR
jgi:hypothetical protein